MFILRKLKLNLALDICPFIALCRFCSKFVYSFKYPGEQCPDADHDARKCEQQDGGKHRAAELLDLLHHNVFVTLSSSLLFVFWFCFCGRPFLLDTGYQVSARITIAWDASGKTGRS